MTVKKRKEAVIIPADTFFYPIPLTQPKQWLTREELYKHFEPPTGRKAYMGNHDEFIAFEHGIATVQLTLNTGLVYTLYLHAEQEELNIACSCGMPDGKLCLHAFIGLFNLSWLSNKYDCQMLYWPGFYNLENSRKFLETKITKRGINVETKPEFGAVYRSGIGLQQYQFPSLSGQSDDGHAIKAGDTDVYAFALCFAPDAYRNRHYPVLVPFQGKTNKSGLIVDTFSSFVLPDNRTNYEDGTTPRKQLNEFSKIMYNLMRPLTYKTDTRDKEVWKQVQHDTFDIWQKALPLLIDRTHNHTYELYHYRYLREKPAKMFIKPCRYSLEWPTLVFLLSVHKGYLMLNVEVTVGGRILPVKHKPHFFVFDEQAGYCYLMKSVQDDELLNWMVNNHNSITVLNSDFEEFDRKVINEISASYAVFYSASNKSRLVYNYDLVKSRLIA